MARERQPSPAPRLRLFLAGYLSFSLALCSIIGISPALHRLIEHAGLGPAHAHAPRSSHSHPHPHSHVHPHHDEGPVADSSDNSPADSDSSPNSSHHSHHSLAQLLAEGLAEPAVLLAILAPGRPPSPGFCLIPTQVSLPIHWDALSASRGPPA